MFSITLDTMKPIQFNPRHQGLPISTAEPNQLEGFNIDSPQVSPYNLIMEPPPKIQDNMKAV
jgi:hypothetical protein